MSVAAVLTITQRLQASQATAAYATPSATELAQATAWFSTELAGQAGAWQALGMQREALAAPPIVLLYEAAEQRRGRGVFALRPQPTALPWLLQAPHSKDDAHTGVLVRQLFSENPVRAAMWNSIGRHTPVPQGGEADMAHLDASYWQAMTEAYARRHADGRIIQLHGFDSGKRRSAAGRGLDMIVSAGHALPPAWVQQTAQCLKTRLSPYAVALYPDEIKELGGTGNAQGQLLRALDHDGFIHLEMSLPLRQALVQDEALRRRLVDCWAGRGL